jgi:hypothetical protein
MTTLTNEIAKKKKAFLQTARVQMDQWRDGLNRLDEAIEQIPPEAQASYRKNIADLRAQWQQVEEAFQRMEQAAAERWEKVQSRWQQTAANYKEAFMETANRIDQKEVPLGWLQGFSDKRTHESAGWAEGMGHRPEGSEGWAEGLGKQESKSKGWSEGYDQAN